MLEKANFISQLDDEDDAVYIPLFQSFSSCSPGYRRWIETTRRLCSVTPSAGTRAATLAALPTAARPWTRTVPSCGGRSRGWRWARSPWRRGHPRPDSIVIVTISAKQVGAAAQVQYTARGGRGLCDAAEHQRPGHHWSWAPVVVELHLLDLLRAARQRR